MKRKKKSSRATETWEYYQDKETLDWLLACPRQVREGLHEAVTFEDGEFALDYVGEQYLTDECMRVDAESVPTVVRYALERERGRR